MCIGNIPDNYSRWEQHEAAQEKALASRPVCSECDEYIQEETAYYINGEWICENCMDTYRRCVDDFCE